MLNSPSHVKFIGGHYDGRCGMCCGFHEWINRQKRAFKIQFIPYQSPLAEKLFPGIGTLDPAREMVVRSDQGAVLRGGETWVWCLYGCAHYRFLFRRISKPPLLGLAVQMCRLLSSNRQSFSKFFFWRQDREVRGALHPMDSTDGDEERCSAEYNEWCLELLR